MVFQNGWEIFPPVKQLGISVRHLLVFDEWSSCERLLDLGCDFSESDIFHQWEDLENVVL
jgi:hypothetical protein